MDIYCYDAKESGFDIIVTLTLPRILSDFKGAPCRRSAIIILAPRHAAQHYTMLRFTYAIHYAASYAIERYAVALFTTYAYYADMMTLYA